MLWLKIWLAVIAAGCAGVGRRGADLGPKGGPEGAWAPDRNPLSVTQVGPQLVSEKAPSPAGDTAAHFRTTGS
ncbi:hypothetical protein [Lactiplantibacillus fabifermentans]|uniref:Uncharacterized protein n=2 Tax=Lactiplantibacillus fabifermentans TaxID=483011 RepID=A0A0R2NP53_9LACO|nr:hypothetical protein [Lactiplantibacillus fabifermentans]ETY74927.1 hypothetical protein LFAB_04580 [Lactiplantibacillus fabifermentans T30PCM01]KRO27481.1 hypothetical protein DY78_GL003173 [Lactiplantibacillus fabifermentans DSM 21115]